MSLPLMKVAAAGHASKPQQSGTAGPAKRDGFTGTHGRVPHAAEERGQAGTDARGSRQEMPDPAPRWRLRCVQLKDGDIGSLW
jgi:hypothetical protein